MASPSSLRDAGMTKLHKRQPGDVPSTLTTYRPRLRSQRRFRRLNFHFHNNAGIILASRHTRRARARAGIFWVEESLPDCQGPSAGLGGFLRAAMVCFGQRRRSTRETDARGDRGANGSKRGPTPVAGAGRRSCILRFFRRGSFAPSLRISFCERRLSLREPAARSALAVARPAVPSRMTVLSLACYRISYSQPASET
jgi:hypothetical protein